MQVVKSYPDGMVSWIDLSTSDAGAAKAFYSSLFGWDFEDIRDGEGELIYRMARIGGHSVTGMGEQDPATREQGIPPAWSTYINHHDVDLVAQKATLAGGTVVVPPMDVLETGRMAIVMDPGGAVFGVWQPASHIGAELVNIPNTLVWNELQTRALDAARDFYHEVFGWEYDTGADGYVSCKVDGRAQAGMVAIEDAWGEVPANWSVYFLVEDLAAATAKAEALGGSILMPPTSAGDVGAFAVVADPQGAVFSLIEYNAEMPPPPPPGY